LASAVTTTARVLTGTEEMRRPYGAADDRPHCAPGHRPSNATHRRPASVLPGPGFAFLLPIIAT
jgi:hypothetical protein